MNLRPRCREWLPLATQQLRLRNLQYIQGLNIQSSNCSPSSSGNCDADGDDEREMLIYYTLHTDKASEAFYTSEALPQRHQQQKWAEICAGDEWRKSNAQCVCVKVWARYQTSKRWPRTSSETEGEMVKRRAGVATAEPQCALSQRLDKVCLTPHTLPRPPELLFCWGVYLSGLIPLAPLTLSKCHPNCLIFQLNGELFTSPEMISAQGLQEQLRWHYQSKTASNLLSNKASSACVSGDNSINSPQVSRSSSPVLGQSERELMRMTTTRYMQLSCNAQDVRRSYNLEQLLKLQRLQRSQRQKLRDSGEISTEISRLSVHCITRNELRYKPRTTSLSGSPYANNLYHSMGRKLSVLLSEHLEIAPQTLYSAQHLTQQIETLRCKHRLLQTEHETFRQRNEQKQQHLQELREVRATLQQRLEAQRLELEQQRVELSTRLQQQRLQRDEKREINRQMERRISTLVLELQEIYNIQRLGAEQLSICGIAFPHMEQYASDTRHISNAQMLENVSPLAVSAALGYVAHLVQMLAIIMDRPLRNPIVYEPSRTRIVDEIKELTYTSREFPLYTRSILPSQQTKKAIYLLKQNVAQICFDITGRCDIRNTLANLLELFRTMREIERSQRIDTAAPADQLDSPSMKGSLNSLPHVNGLSTAPPNQQLSESNSSVDMNHAAISTTAKEALLQLLPVGVSQTLSIDGYASTQRICRSVGSYSDNEDDDYRPILEQNYSNSDSNIALQTERS
ncbi:UV radiation resistance-associated gene protein [Scaptodrosophila lebanonensis]|uniref:UV radiation resistance-associated gene protein n=1 Tax=Drosophila lebanonensis TaxID=7225 RepID=A0A6J2TMQ4_DROLE|nr:UV radiation resistance-associated gene protein [Scaptodrosophila lebanonensis]